MSTRAEVLRALKSASDGPISGEALARTLGVSRVAVSKHISALRAQGYRIDAEPGRGYRLLAVPDEATPEEVESLIRNPFWAVVTGSMETASTNDDARALAQQGAGEGTVVVAARQRAGRGRLGRTWASPAGGAYFSAILRPGVAPSQVGPLALVVAVGVARGLAALGVEVGLKWPNDVQLAGGKLAGILLEMTAEAEAVQWVVAGVGVNVRRSSDTAPGAAFVSDELPEASAAQVAAAALDGIASAYEQWRADGFARMRAEFEARSVLAGKHVVVSDLLGKVHARGVVMGVDEEGRLLLQDEAGNRAVAAGEVTLRS